MSVRRTTAIGLSLAVLIFIAWAGLGCVALGLVPWQVWWPAAPAVIAVQCWLYVGLFIVAHDTIHGTLAPEWPALTVRSAASLCCFMPDSTSTGWHGRTTPITAIRARNTIGI